MPDTNGYYRKKLTYYGGYRSLGYPEVRAVLAWIASPDYNRLGLRCLLAYLSTSLPAKEPNVVRIKELMRDKKHSKPLLARTLQQTTKQVKAIAESLQDDQRRADLPRRVLAQLAAKTTRYEALICLLGMMQFDKKNPGCFRLNQNRVSNRFKVRQQHISRAVQSLIKRGVINKPIISMDKIKQCGAKYVFCCAERSEILTMYARK